MTMDRDAELGVVRRAFAKQVLCAADVRSAPALEDALAMVRREDFLGPGPWSILRWGGYRETPTADPVYLYTNDLVAIDAARGISNGEPSLHAGLIASVAPAEGEHVVHVGAGVGYYTAILARVVGPAGRVTAIEYEADLAARAEANLAAFGNVRVVAGDGTATPFDVADVIYVNAGATRPADLWLDNLAEGGRLILPLTTGWGKAGEPGRAPRRGAVFRVERRGGDFEARPVSAVRIFPCVGARDEAGEAALAAAFERGPPDRVTRLCRGGRVPAERRWLDGGDWCLAYD